MSSPSSIKNVCNPSECDYSKFIKMFKTTPMSCYFISTLLALTHSTSFRPFLLDKLTKYMSSLDSDTLDIFKNPLTEDWKTSIPEKERPSYLFYKLIYFTCIGKDMNSELITNISTTLEGLYNFTINKKAIEMLEEYIKTLAKENKNKLKDFQNLNNLNIQELMDTYYKYEGFEPIPFERTKSVYKILYAYLNRDKIKDDEKKKQIYSFISDNFIKINNAIPIIRRIYEEDRVSGRLSKNIVNEIHQFSNKPILGSDIAFVSSWRTLNIFLEILKFDENTYDIFSFQKSGEYSSRKDYKFVILKPPFSFKNMIDSSIGAHYNPDITLKDIVPHRKITINNKTYHLACGTLLSPFDKCSDKIDITVFGHYMPLSICNNDIYIEGSKTTLEGLLVTASKRSYYPNWLIYVLEEPSIRAGGNNQKQKQTQTQKQKQKIYNTTKERVMIGKSSRIVYVNSRGKKYIRKDGQYVPIQ